MLITIKSRFIKLPVVTYVVTIILDKAASYKWRISAHFNYLLIKVNPFPQRVPPSSIIALTPPPPSAAYMNWVSIDSDNGLSPVRRLAITWTNAHLLSIGPFGTKFSEIWIKIQNFSFKKLHLNTSSAKWRPFCQDEDELKSYTYTAKLTFRT